jgi:hypothetical protein
LWVDLCVVLLKSAPQYSALVHIIDEPAQNIAAFLEVFTAFDAFCTPEALPQWPLAEYCK